MKKLRNNFTTPEQSKRLLELGVPADSANLFYSKFECETFENRPTLCYDKKYSDIVPYGYEKDYLPCWSVGRLIEIMNICSIHNIVSIYRTDRDVTQIDIIIETIINRINGNSINFSKLEE